MLKGTLDDFTLPDIVRLAARAKRTGRLEVQRRAGSGKVFFRDGEVYYAESSVSKEPLGQKLIWSGAVSQSQLQKALDENVRTGKRVGDILLDTGVVTLAQIQNAVRSQMEDAIFDLLRWDYGEFEWETGTEIDAEIAISADVERLVEEASRRIEELAAIKRRIPSPDVVLAMAERPPQGAHEINITGEEWRVLVLVDGRRSVADIASAIGADAFKTTRTLFRLLEEGLIETHGIAEPVEDELPEDDRAEQAFRTEAPEKWFEETGAADPAEDAAAIVELDEDHERDEPAEPVPAQEARKAPAPPGPDAPRVDRAAVVRELAGLFSDEERPRRHNAPQAQTEVEEPHANGKDKRRIEDDDDVNRTVISRMIDGVKGL